MDKLYQLKPQNKYEIKEKLRKTSLAQKFKTGKKATKKELAESLGHIIKFLPKEKKNWKEPNQPKSIKSILGIK